jgi:hypothetical protein
LLEVTLGYPRATPTLPSKYPYPPQGYRYLRVRVRGRANTHDLGPGRLIPLPRMRVQGMPAGRENIVKRANADKSMMSSMCAARADKSTTLRSQVVYQTGARISESKCRLECDNGASTMVVSSLLDGLDFQDLSNMYTIYIVVNL